MQGRHAPGPEELVQEKRSALDQYLGKEGQGYPEIPVKAFGKGMAVFVPVGPYRDNGEFHKTGDNRGAGGTRNSKFRYAEVAKDQDIVKRKID